ncbi:hypothetical protein [Tumebacillus permanentifrigoris]|uniref:Membrane protein YesL n=1 Tax=Tumebacillus permanentifrigoris TaxID=378543 RepID=A0A316D5M7_9BACL|nr:hypothetical protein [Tumebacillus permanentifrigoris]PWK06587.1 hypothetical protein C7459_11910 [Tumebacillus permanentifrigoris]
MSDALRLVHKAVFETYRQLGFAIGLTLLWLCCSWPLVTIGPATGAVLYTIHRRAQGEVELWPCFREGLVRITKPTLALSMLNLLVMVPAACYLFLLMSSDHGWVGQLLSWTVLYVVVMAVLVQVIAYPLLVLQPATRLPELLKQAYLLAGKHPLSVVCVLLLTSILTLICVAVPILFLTIWPVLIGHMMYYHLLHLLSKYHPTRYALDLRVSWRGQWKPWR